MTAFLKSSLFTTIIPSYITALFTLALFWATWRMVVATKQMSTATEKSNRASAIQFKVKKDNLQRYLISALENYEDLLARIVANNPQGYYLGIVGDDLLSNLSDFIPYFKDNSILADVVHMQVRLRIFISEYLLNGSPTPKAKSNLPAFSQQAQTLLTHIRDLKNKILTSEDWKQIP
jgi:hypothetical protein